MNRLRVLTMKLAGSLISMLLMPALLLASPVLLLRWYSQRRRLAKTVIPIRIFRDRVLTRCRRGTK